MCFGRSKAVWVSCVRTSHDLAAGLGLEPRYLGPKPSVLPLDDPAMGSEYNKTGRAQTLAPWCVCAMIYLVALAQEKAMNGRPCRHIAADGSRCNRTEEEHDTLPWFDHAFENPDQLSLDLAGAPRQVELQLE